MNILSTDIWIPPRSKQQYIYFIYFRVIFFSIIAIWKLLFSQKKINIGIYNLSTTKKTSLNGAITFWKFAKNLSTKLKIRNRCYVSMCVCLVSMILYIQTNTSTIPQGSQYKCRCNQRAIRVIERARTRLANSINGRMSEPHV